MADRQRGQPPGVRRRHPRNWVIRFDGDAGPGRRHPAGGRPGSAARPRRPVRPATCVPPAAADYVLGDAAVCGQSDWVGAPSPAEGEFHTPMAVAVDGRGRIFVADTGNDRIQVFTADGDFDLLFGNDELTPAPASLGVVDVRIGGGRRRRRLRRLRLRGRPGAQRGPQVHLQRALHLPAQGTAAAAELTRPAWVSTKEGFAQGVKPCSEPSPGTSSGRSSNSIPSRPSNSSCSIARGSFTDDTVLTVATAFSLLTDGDYRANYRLFGRLYPKAGYGGMFKRWLQGPGDAPYGSLGNGSAMRVAPIGFAFDDEDRVLAEAARSAAVTHDHPEGIKGAQAVALGILLARQGAARPDIGRELGRRFGYDLSRTPDLIRPGYGFDETCPGSVPEAICCFLAADDWEHAVRLAVSLGGRCGHPGLHRGRPGRGLLRGPAAAGGTEPCADTCPSTCWKSWTSSGGSTPARPRPDRPVPRRHPPGGGIARQLFPGNRRRQPLPCRLTGFRRPWGRPAGAGPNNPGQERGAAAVDFNVLKKRFPKQDLPRTPFYLSIAGNIGVGKSMVTTMIGRGLRLAHVLRAGHQQPVPRRLLPRHAALELPPAGLLPEQAVRGAEADPGRGRARPSRTARSTRTSRSSRRPCTGAAAWTTATTRTTARSSAT